MPPDLTPTRTRILSAALTLGAGATLRAVAQKVHLSHEAVRLQVKILRNLGYLEPPDSRFASLVLTERAKVSLGLGIPIYGQIAAGRPILAEQEPDHTTPSLDALLGVREGDFLLEVRGDSMIGIGVMNGDWVLVRPATTVTDGEVAVVLVPGDNAATLKRLYHLHDEVVLLSENPEHPRQSYSAADIQVQGRMVGRLGMVPGRASLPAKGRG
ncbi:repressor LexA [Deinococcus sp. HMF7620]|uniref:Repressor LexA n=1 Tax=Deinococcus arboris TaxID=2682977 RepID=A0A7C9M987_9DEIO|nr:MULTISPECIES: LexA family transcriptional regulator [Deinococcus]MBZ9752169.1 LexA family transcriptional regulator [Deinococcus betulae]MVN87479.1 repressor LexA [Deinococcus arboris]